MIPNVSNVLKGETQIERIYKGSDLVWENSKLPTGYTLCEYLESTGTQYINLPYGFDETDEVYLKSSLNSTKSDDYILCPTGWNTNNNRFAIGGIWSTYFTVGFGEVGTSTTIFVPNVKRDYLVHEFTYKNRVFFIDNGLARSNCEGILFGGTTYPLRLFFGYNSNTKGCVYAMKHKKNGVYVLNLIPCLDDTGRPCMYDTVSKTPFYNQGTDEFRYMVAIPKQFKHCLYVSGNRDCSINFSFTNNDIIDLDMRFTTIGKTRQLISIVDPIQQGQCSYFGIDEIGRWELGGGIYYREPIGNERTSLSISSPSYGTVSMKIGNDIKTRTGGAGIYKLLMHMFTDIGIQYAIQDKVEYYEVKVFDGDVLTKLLVPCLDSNETPCFYDALTKETLYTKSGHLEYELLH